MVVSCCCADLQPHRHLLFVGDSMLNQLVKEELCVHAPPSPALCMRKCTTGQARAVIVLIALHMMKKRGNMFVSEGGPTAPILV